MLAPISWRVPPRHYGPWEQVVSDLTEGLVANGIDVTLFATADSITGARLDAVVDRSYSEDHAADAKVLECLHISHAFEQAGEFDLIHNNFDFLPLTYSGLISTPVLTTIHGFSSPKILPVYERYNGRTHYVSISDSDRAPSLNYIATIHHGIRMDRFRPSGHAEGYLLFYGRIHPDKGCAEAIAVAKMLRRPLIIAGIIQDKEYFEREVKPHLTRSISFIGPVGPDRRNEVLAGATALLHLINFNEPFGLSVIEAMACGTPVIACNRGSMPELIQHGRNGCLVDSVQEAAECVEHVARFDRREIRASVENAFSVERMVADYIAVYSRICEVATV